MRAEVKASGIVQGVGFRPFIYRIAVEHQLVGYVRNRGDAHVEIMVEGKEKDVESFLQSLVEEKPPFARISSLKTKYLKDNHSYREFAIIQSSEETKFSGSVSPADLAICDECLKEMRDPNDKRSSYFFITCTNCGPRYTTIERLPYDRKNTTMQKFVMCDFCYNEYTTVHNRRFHAQTAACPSCGPRVYLTNSDGEKVESKSPIRDTGKLLEEGYIAAIKGYGGFHVATATTKSEPIAKLRSAKHRSRKPFAVMARNLETAESFAEVNVEEARLLTSHVRPIVLLKKKNGKSLSKLIAPGLHNIGVMLPYTGMHHMLFDEVEELAFVMTSANPPNEPIVVEEREALRKLGCLVDYFLFHNRPIAQRCDDSVVRFHQEKTKILRRSRGYSPEPFRLKKPVNTKVLGLGAELNATSCILDQGNGFMSQHIGNVENLENLQFLRNATEHLLQLTNCNVETIACDLHPKFATTSLARELGEKLGVPVIPIQHHHAHATALMAEHNVAETVCIVCDGYGYGSDGSPWGGEILHCTEEGEFRRLGHLQPQPMVGGDLATRYPIRMAAGILHGKPQIEEWLHSNCERFPHGQRELDTVLLQLDRPPLPSTTSCGRVLDAVAAVVGVCFERTYAAEPAMKVESAAIGGRDVLNLQLKTEENVVDTCQLVYETFVQRKNFSTADLAFSAQSYVARSLAQLASAKAKNLGVDNVGFSGGVAYNEHITSAIGKIVEENGLKFMVHELVPPGDGGISFGQALAAAWQLKA